MAVEKNEDRITIEALKYYVPMFQQGEYAEEKILNSVEKLDPGEKNHLETIMKLKDLAARKIASLSAPLITKEINKIIASSHLRNRDDLFDILYYAGIDGMKRGLRKFDVNKINKSSTNYLFQWIMTYAKKELIVLEAPFGIPPSRFQRYKKISAVRKKLSEQLDRYASNVEVFDFFQSGKADIKTMNGKVGSNTKPSKANRNITLDIIEEQERFEKEMLSVSLLDPLDNYSGDVLMSEKDNVPFDETVFGVFVNTYNITDEARVVIMSDLSVHSLNKNDGIILESLSSREYKQYSNKWKNLIKDKNGPFYKFLKDNETVSFTQFDVKMAIRNIENYSKRVNSSLYKSLFENGKVMKK